MAEVNASNWKLELDHLLEIFERESTTSLRKINRCFAASGRPFGEEFRQYFLNVSSLRLDASFKTVLFEQLDGNQVQISSTVSAPAQGVGGMADAGTERNGNPNEDHMVHGRNVGVAYQEGVDSAAAHNNLNNIVNAENAVTNETNAENESNARANRIAVRRGREEEGVIGRTRGSNALPNNSANQANNRAAATYRTRVAREREQQDIDDDDEDEDDDHTAISVLSDSSDGTLSENQLSSSSDSSDSHSVAYSDWVNPDADQPILVPPKRSRRNRIQPRSYSPSEGSSNRNIPTPGPRRGLPIGDNNEIPEIYRPPEWLSEVIPRKAPYYPQMGDEVVYFRQGHKLYLEAVQQKNVYILPPNCEPWSRLDLRDYECVKVIGIKYEIRPPRLCCLKLAFMNNNGKLKNQTFTIKYHDMPNVLDFLVLKQTYDTAVRRLWQLGDRFRCMIVDDWWFGQITDRVPYSEDFSESLFLCFQIRWDSGETERMSPWDMEPIDRSRSPNEAGGVVHVQAEELQSMLYQPTKDEWPGGDRDGTCRRIVAGLDEVMGLAIADPFLVPVDLNIYPTYAFVVKYPIDLTTIKARFENHFYRRLASAQFDVRFLATNAEQFNQSDSHIVKNARIITDLCLKIIQDYNEIDVTAVYHRLVATYTSDLDENQPGTSTGTTTPAGRRRSRRNAALNSSASSSGGDWRDKCRRLLDIIWNNNDSIPFREPVDVIEHADYLQVVDTPMDLRTVKKKLLGSNYQSKSEFLKDMRMISANSRNYNTNAHSRIYVMTLRMSKLFEEQLEKIFKGSSSRLDRPTRGKRRRNSDATHSNALRNGGPNRSRNVRHHSSVEDEEIDVVNGDTPSTSTGRPMRQIRVRQSNQMTNGLSTSQNDSSESNNASENYYPNEPESSRRKIKKKERIRRRVNGTTTKRPRRLAFHESSDDDHPPEEEDETSAVNSQKSQRHGRRGRPRKDQVIASDEESEHEANGNVEIEENEEENDSEQSDEEEQSDGEHSEEVDQSEQEQAPATQRRSKRNQPSVCSLTRRSRRNQSENSDTQPLRPKRSVTTRRFVQQEEVENSYDETNDHVSISTRRTAATKTNTHHGQRLRVCRQVLQEVEIKEDIDVEEPIRLTLSTRRKSSRTDGIASQQTDDDDSDDQPLSQMLASQSRPKRSPRGSANGPFTTEVIGTTSPVHQNGQYLSRTRGKFRHKQLNNSSTANTTTVTSNSNHQRKLTRSMTTATATATTTTETTLQIERRRNQVQEDDNYGEPGPSTIRHSTRIDRINRTHESIVSNNRTPRKNTSNVDIDNDPDDNIPLHQLVAESPNQRSSVRPSRQSTCYSNQHINKSQQTANMQTCRTQKRPLYLEDTDEEDGQQAKRSATHGRLGTGYTRKERNRSQYVESSDSFNDDADAQSNHLISVSSRGRHRKITSTCICRFLCK